MLLAISIFTIGYLPPRSQLLMGGMILAVLFIFHNLQRFLGRPGKIFLLFLAGFLTSRYWFFRTVQTLSCGEPLHLFFAVILYLAETYAILIHIFGMVMNIWPLDRTPEPLPDNQAHLPSVDVYVPTYDEPPDIVKLTVTAVLQMRYPRDKLNVYILDDGGTKQRLESADPAIAEKAIKRSEALKAIAYESGAFYHTRDFNLQAKAGNINEAFLQCECAPDWDEFDRISCLNANFNSGCGQLILILDCDHVPTRDFLSNTVGFFLKDPNLYLVQTPHHFINPGPVEKNLGIFHKGPAENEMFYGVIQRGLDFWNASFFCGSAAILRRAHLMAAGGLSGETITEDVETSLKLHAMGFNSIYLFRPMIIGLSPETYDNFILQRSRWAQGMVQVLRLKNPLFQKGLTLPQRLGYFNSCFFWFFGLARIIFYLAPMMFLLFGMKIYNDSLIQVLAYGAPHLIAAYYVANQLYGDFRHPFFSEFYETVQSIYLAPAILSAFFRPRTPVFKVTPKAISLKSNFLSHLALPFYLMLLTSAGAQVIGWLRWHELSYAADALLLCTIWNCFNFFLLLCCLGVVWERRQRRSFHRFPVSETVQLTLEGKDEMLTGRVLDLSANGFFCCMEANPGITVGTRATLIATDSYGEPYELQASVQHCHSGTDGFYIGAAFDMDTPKKYRQVVGYVFGDSHRWKFYGQDKKTPTISTLKGLTHLLILSITGSFHNIRGLVTLLVDTIQEKYPHLRLPLKKRKGFKK